MAFKGFFLFVDKSKVFASDSFAKKGQKVPVMKAGDESKGGASLAAINAFKSFYKRTKSYNMADALPEIVEAVNHLGYSAEYVAETFDYPSRIKFMPITG